MAVVPVRGAFVTLAATDEYCPGAQVLAYSLRHHNTRHSLVCLVTSNLSPGSKAALQAVFDEVVEVPQIDSGDASNLGILGRPNLGVTFTKIEAWTLTEYSIACFLDADTLVFRNIDELLDGTTYQPFAAAPDSGWPDCFNSGVFVFRPSREDYAQLKKLASDQGSFDGADQGLLNTYFSSWSRSGIEHRLPFKYNVTPSAVYSYAPAFRAFHEDIAIFHFIGVKKPWHWLRLHDGGLIPNGEQFMIDAVRKWWEIHDIYVSDCNGQGVCPLEGGLSTGHAQGAGVGGVPSLHAASPKDLGDYRIDWDAEDALVEPVYQNEPTSTSSETINMPSPTRATKAGSLKPNREVRLMSYPRRTSDNSPAQNNA